MIQKLSCRRQSPGSAQQQRDRRQELDPADPATPGVMVLIQRSAGTVNTTFCLCEGEPSFLKAPVAFN